MPVSEKFEWAFGTALQSIANRLPEGSFLCELGPFLQSFVAVKLVQHLTMNGWYDME